MNKHNDRQHILIREVGLMLGECDVRPTDNFIELGGTSFLAIQLASFLKDKEQLEVDVAELLGYCLNDVSIRPIDHAIGVF